MKSYRFAKGTVWRMRRKPTDRESTFAKDKSLIIIIIMSDNKLLCKVYKELLKYNNKKIDNPSKNGPKTRTSPKKKYRWQIEYKKMINTICH